MTELTKQPSAPFTVFPVLLVLLLMGNVDSSNAYAGVDELKDTLTGLET